MQQHLGRLDGVAKVDVNLLNGKVVIYPKSDSSLDPAAVWKATYDSGVTVAEMNMAGTGTIVRDPQGNLVFKPSANQSFPVIPSELSKQVEALAGSAAPVTLRGRLYKKPPGKQKPRSPGPLRLEILEVLPSEAPKKE